MSSSPATALRRERFIVAPGEAHPRYVLKLLLAQDGSTTRLCETVAGGPVELHVLHQRITDEVPAPVRAHLPGTRFIERITCLAAHGEVLMDNLSYVALAGLPADIEADLLAGTMPIGHLLGRMWNRRESIEAPEVLTQRLWRCVTLPDASATRAYRIVTADAAESANSANSARMLIVETYRHGMLMDRG